jgi:hypothetical protein
MRITQFPLCLCLEARELIVISTKSAFRRLSGICRAAGIVEAGQKAGCEGAEKRVAGGLHKLS